MATTGSGATLNRTRAPRSVLVVANNFAWIIGTIARDLERAISDEWDVVFASTDAIRRQGAVGVAAFTELASRVDLVHSLDPYLYRYVPLPLDRPLVTSIHHVVDWADEAPNTAADVTVTLSPEWHQYVGERSLRPHATVPLGVDTTFWRPVKRRRRTRRSIHARPGQFVVGFFATAGGNVGDRKGIGTLCDVLGRLAEHEPANPPLLVTAGSDWDDLAEQIRARGVEVHNENFVSARRLRALYTALDVYVMCSHEEGGPAPVLESMACGTPCVATAIGVAPLAIRSGINGILAAPRDVTALTESLTQLRASPLRRAEMGRAARATVVASFDSVTSYRAFLPLYERAVEHARSERQTVEVDPVRRARRDPAGNAAAVLEDHLQTLLVRPHRLSAVMDLGRPIRVLARQRAWRSLARGVHKAMKVELVSHSQVLRRLARRRAAGS